MVGIPGVEGASFGDGLPPKDEAQELAQMELAPPSGPGQTEFVNIAQAATKTLTNDKGET